MRVLVSSAGTRGDVQPVLALAVQVRGLGHEVRLCVPPNFLDWVGGHGFDAVPMGVPMRAPRPGAAPVPVPDLITDQFDTLDTAVKGCDVVLGANAHQYAARSIAEREGVPYVNALYAPVALPSPEHAPPPAPGQAWEPGSRAGNERRWSDTRAAWNARALERVNHNRARLGLAGIDDVLRHNLTDRPWLAADATLGPAPATPGMDVTQTGAWLLPDPDPLPPPLQAFLDGGDPPVYVGFGSMPMPPDTGRILIDAARAAGRRVVLSQGWAELGPVDDGADCIAVGDVNQQALFPRVAVAVHHGGAGTTVAAARAGVPQVVVPIFSDQFYWAARVATLGIGTSVPPGVLSTGTLAAALHEALLPAVEERAGATAWEVSTDGAAVAARLLVAAAG
ncbi:glycosyltransferase [Dactylosporangium sp. NPDC049525]|uniref:glycosyltransferase n=1 Tax=Dactylosporangium sp. NPDC049525 TaxID=3154730 RepID=UPI0034273E7B